MQSLAAHMPPWFGWLLHASWQAGVLVGLILLIRAILGHRLGVRGRYALWLVLLVRMALPWTPQSGLSLYNLLPSLSFHGDRSSARHGAPAASATAAEMSTGTEPGTARPKVGELPDVKSASLDSRNVRLGRRAAVLLTLLWLAGVAGLTTYTVAGSIRLHYTLRRGRPVTDPWVLRILEDCRRLMGTRAVVTVLATNEVPSPALCGIARPRLLMPERTLVEAGRGSLRCIFLHELAHLKRQDILVGHVMSALHVLHWFNPLIALGLHRMRADRELACDALALSVLPPDETITYGRAVVAQIERLFTTDRRWAVASLGGDRSRIRERIAMISRFHAGSYRWSPVTALLIALLACIGLTERLAGNEAVEPPATPWDAYARGDFATAYGDRHANIQRCCIRNLATGKYLTVDGERLSCEADEPGETGLWEFRFDEASITLDGKAYFYSVAARKYLTSDGQGNLAAGALEPTDAACWATVSGPRGVRVVPHACRAACLGLAEDGGVEGSSNHTAPTSYWDVHRVWRVKTSDDPKSDPQWQRDKIPGPD